jgi:hypothetical protein
MATMRRTKMEAPSSSGWCLLVALGGEENSRAEAVEQSPRWEHEGKEEKDFSFGEGIMQRIKCVELWATHVGVVGKGGGVRRRLCGQSGAGSRWPFGQVGSGWFRTAVGRYGRVASGPKRHRAVLCSGPSLVNLFQYSKYFPIAFK